MKIKLHVKDNRTIEAYILENILPEPVEQREDGELLFSKEEVAIHLGIPSLNEQFLDSRQAARLLGISLNQVYGLMKKGSIPFYRFSHIRGNCILYLRSELEAANKLFIQRSSLNFNQIGKDNVKRQIISKLLDEHFNLLSLRDRDMFYDILIEDKSLAEAAKKYERTTDRIKQLFSRAVRLIGYRLDEISKRLEKANRSEKELEMIKRRLEHFEAEKKFNLIPEETRQILFKSIREMGFSTRLNNICSRYRINTVTDLIKYSRDRFQRIPAAGKKTVQEVDAFLRENGLHWEMSV